MINLFWIIFITIICILVTFVVLSIIFIPALTIVLLSRNNWQKFQNEKQQFLQAYEKDPNVLRVATFDKVNDLSFDYFIENVLSKMTNKKIQMVSVNDFDIDVLLFSQYSKKIGKSAKIDDNVKIKMMFVGEANNNIFHRKLSPKHYDVKFDFTSDEKEKESVQKKSIRFPFYFFYRMRFNFDQKRNWDIAQQLFAKKSKFCCFVVSNNMQPMRRKMFEKLSQYKKVDSVGKYLNNMPYGNKANGWILPKDPKYEKEFLSQYKFCICFENQSFDGYTTEKLFTVWNAGAVPIYWGNKKLIEQDKINPKSIVNTHTFENLDQVVDYIKYLDNNDQAYISMLAEYVFQGSEQTLPKEFQSATIAQKINLLLSPQQQKVF